MSDETTASTVEHQRLRESPYAISDWRAWGPYVSGRQWGTVREDYSGDGNAWEYFPFDHAHHRAYRWGEDGIAGLSDRYGFLNLGLALWNGRDDRLKERLFGLSGPQGNHGEDVKEYWWHLDATPTHSYGEYLYRYPQAAFPYQQLVQENAARGYQDAEFELAETGILEQDRFFDVVTRHAKRGPYDMVIEIEATNHGPDPAPLDVLQQAWFRNTWAWGVDDRKPTIERVEGDLALRFTHDWLGTYYLIAEDADGAPSPRILMCDNETDTLASFGTQEGQADHPTNAIGDAIVTGDESRLADGPSTKAAFHWHHDAIAPGESATVRLRLICEPDVAGRDLGPLTGEIGAILQARRADADEFYDAVIPAASTPEHRQVARRAFAGLMWCKQVYRYDVKHWLQGDPASPPPPGARAAKDTGRNVEWQHMALADVISMPDEWEYPWFASWDLAFHCVAIAHIDPAFAKDQLILMCREWAQHPNGQLPAYEWNFSDVNPPVHAWATWQVYAIEGAKDTDFLIRVFTKLMLNFGWWVNRKDADDSGLFEGGFLGMDNIGPFDRSEPLHEGQRLEQSDATSWMAFFCLNMLRMAWELARHQPAWDEAATKFLEHFLAIAEAMRSFGTDHVSLWDEDDGFFYDVVAEDSGQTTPIRVRSMTGLLPVMAIAGTPAWVEHELSDYTAHLTWLLKRRPESTGAVIHNGHHGERGPTLAVLGPHHLPRVLARILDEAEFLSPHGIRSLSAAHADGVTVTLDGRDLSLAYTPGESDNGMFGGNSNWRGPVWFPVNVLLTDAIRTYGIEMLEDTTVEYPTGSGQQATLVEVARGLEDRLIALFEVGEDGRRPSDPASQPTGPLWGQAHPTFSEYFHGDSGVGLGASHQAGWTALVAHLICTAGRDAADGGDTQPRT